MYLRPSTRTKVGMAVGTKGDTKMAEGRSRSSKTRHSGGRRKIFLLAPWDRRSPPHPPMPFGDQEEAGVGSRGESKGSGPSCESCHEVLELGAVQGLAATMSPPIFPAFGAHADVPPSIDVHTFGAADAAAPTHAHAATVSIRTFMAEPTHPPSNPLRPATSTTSTKARGT
jgi:hypothetical protein